jgi:anaerobic magnesium-protoporphyrin IX monomethyl ester cyclase
MRKLKVHCILPSSPWLADSKTNIPLGVLYIAAVLREKGHDVFVTSRLGCRANDPYDWSPEVGKADVHMFGFCTPQFNECIDMAADLRQKFPGSLIVAGGSHPSYEPLETVTAVDQGKEHPNGVLRKRRDYTKGVDNQPVFDSAIVMEGEVAILRLLEDWEAGKLERTYYGGKDEIPNLDIIPFPAWDLLPFDHIYNDGVAVMKKNYFPTRDGGHGPCLSMIGTRGCPYKCIYCSTPWIGQKPRYRSSHNIITEMANAMDLGIKMFKFQDDTYTLHKSKLRELATEINSAFGPGSFACRIHTRVNTMDDHIAESLKLMNCKVTCFGIESGSQKVLDANWKGTTVKQNTEALKKAKEHGFYTIAFLVAGLAGETMETARETMSWLSSVKPYLDSCNLAVGIPYPGSRFWSHPVESRIEILDHNYDHQWIVGFSARNEILVRPYESTVDEMMALKAEMFEFLRAEGWAKAEWDEDDRIKRKGGQTADPQFAPAM